MAVKISSQILLVCYVYAFYKNQVINPMMCTKQNKTKKKVNAM